jgi:hypothetical protein
MSNFGSLLGAFVATDSEANAFVTFLSSNAAGWTWVLIGALGNWEELLTFLSWILACVTSLGRFVTVCSSV